MGGTYLVNRVHFTTARPANLDWKDMVDGVVFRPNARENFTVSLFFLTFVGDDWLVVWCGVEVIVDFAFLFICIDGFYVFGEGP
jgi:hypothetical protein